jgi:hypothetical protein
MRQIRTGSGFDNQEWGRHVRCWNCCPATLQDDQVPDIARHVETEESLKNAYKHLLKTQIGDDEAILKHFDESNINYPLLGLGLHQANVCVACDRFITGIAEIKWVAKDTCCNTSEDCPISKYLIL